MAVELPRCRCNQRLFYLSGDGKIRLRASILIFKSDGAVAICPKCGAEVRVDLALGDGLRKALAAPPKRLVIRTPERS